jgi:hypothetical protein
MINTVTVMGNEYDPDLSNNTAAVVTEVHYKSPLERVCIIVPKIYSSCKTRHCFEKVDIPLTNDDLSFVDIKFRNGDILDQTITPLADRPGYARVQLNLTIPYVLTLKDSMGEFHHMNGHLPTISLDIIHFYPNTRSAISFSFYTSTSSQLLTPVIINNCTLTISVGSFILSYVAMSVQLEIPSFGYCPEPSLCENYKQNYHDLCKNFLDPYLNPFPSNFY